MSANKVDYYTLLEVPRGATLEQIKKAYKKLAIKWHPDKNPDNKDEAVEKFRDISEAYQRSKYDRYGFDGAKLSGSSGSTSTRFNYNDADDLFRSFFSSYYGFEKNSPDSSFFDAYFKASAGRSGGSGNTYYKYSAPSGGSASSAYSSYFSKPGESSSYSYSSKPADYFSTYSKYTNPKTYYTASGSSTSGTTSSPTKPAEDEQLPAEGQTIKKVHHVTRKFADGTEETIVRTTIISSDGSKEITEEDMYGNTKQKYTVLGTSKKENIKVDSTFSGYNFGKRESTTTTDSSPKEPASNPQSSEPTSGTTSGTSYGNSGTSYRTYYATSGSSGSSSGYRIPSDMYANVTRTYSGGTKVYYADGTEAPTTSGTPYGGGSSDLGSSYGTKVYYTVRK